MSIFEKSIESISEYIYAAFVDDNDIFMFFDKSEKVKDISDCTESVINKLKQYESAIFFGVEENGVPIGFLCVSYQLSLLISFGVGINYRGDGSFYKMIKKYLPINCNCVLFSYNKRAITFLVKNGFDIQADSVTVLKLK